MKYHAGPWRGISSGSLSGDDMVFLQKRCWLNQFAHGIRVARPSNGALFRDRGIAFLD